MKKPITFGVIVVAAVCAIALMSFVFEGNTVEAVKPEPQPEVQKTPTIIELTPVASSTGFLLRNGPAELYFGDELCGISHVPIASVYIEFATDTLVKHGVADCTDPPNELDLAGNVDSNFKAGDILVLDWNLSEPQRWIEVYREQAP